MLTASGMKFGLKNTAFDWHTVRTYFSNRFDLLGLRNDFYCSKYNLYEVFMLYLFNLSGENDWLI